MAVLSILFLGVAVASLAWIVLDILTRERFVDPREGRFEEERRAELRAGSQTYLWMEPAIDEIAASFAPRTPAMLQVLDQTGRDLVAAGERLRWRPAEYLAARRVEAILAGLVAAAFGWLLGGASMAVIFAPLGFFGFEQLSRRALLSHALRRRIQLKRRFAAAIDLMALMMEVGSGFQEALSVAAKESAEHPLGYELTLVERDIRHGKLTKDCLRDFAKRVQEDDINEIVASIVEGIELGTPLASIFRTQADQMRQKRSKWAEMAAQESQVLLVFPAMVIMVACLLTVAAPFVLSVLDISGGQS